MVEQICLAFAVNLGYEKWNSLIYLIASKEGWLLQIVRGAVRGVPVDSSHAEAAGVPIEIAVHSGLGAAARIGRLRSSLSGDGVHWPKR